MQLCAKIPNKIIFDDLTSKLKSIKSMIKWTNKCWRFHKEATYTTTLSITISGNEKWQPASWFGAQLQQLFIKEFAPKRSFWFPHYWRSNSLATKSFPAVFKFGIQILLSVYRTKSKNWGMLLLRRITLQTVAGGDKIDDHISRKRNPKRCVN